MKKFLLPNSIRSLLSGSSRSKADEGPLSVADLYLGPTEGFQKTTGNALLDQVVRRAGSSEGMRFESLEQHPDLAQAVRDASPAELGDLLARSIVVMNHCKPWPYLPASFGSRSDLWFHEHTELGRAVYGFAKNLLDAGSMYLDPHDAEIVRTILCDPSGDLTRGDANAHSSWDCLGLSPAYEVQSIIPFAEAILEGLENRNEALEPHLAEVFDQLADKWDRYKDEIGYKVTTLRGWVALVRREVSVIKHPDLPTRRLAQANGDEVLIKLMELARHPLICDALVSCGDPVLRPEDEAGATRWGVPISIRSAIESEIDPSQRGALIAAAARTWPFALESLTVSYGSVIDYGIGEVARIIWHYHIPEPARFEPDDALDAIRCLPFAKKISLTRSLLRDVDRGADGFADAVLGLISRTELYTKSETEMRQSVAALKAALPDSESALDLDAQKERVTKRLDDAMAVFSLLTPELCEEPDRWHKQASETLGPDLYEQVAEELEGRSWREAPGGIKQDRDRWVKYRALREQRDVVLNRALADAFRLARLGQDNTEVLQEVQALDDARVAYWNNDDNCIKEYERHFGPSQTAQFSAIAQHRSQRAPNDHLTSTVDALKARSAFYLTSGARETFVKLEEFCAEAPNGSKPSAAWRKKAAEALSAEELQVIGEHLGPFLRSTDPGLPSPVFECHELADAPLLGLVWMMADWSDTAPLLADYALRCYVTEPGRGIRAEKIGNGCLWALQVLPGGVGTPYLARIAARVRYPKVKKKIDAALNAAAAAAGVERAELDEMIVPHHGFVAGARRIETDHGVAAFAVDQATVTLSWENAQGKPVKAPPQAMKDNAGDEIKAARALLKEVSADISVQMKRIENLPLQARRIPAEVFLERYLDHPLIGAACRTLIWSVGDTPALWSKGALRDLEGAEVGFEGEVSLWHPVTAEPETVIAWRDLLERQDVVQAIKQAWREVYVVTEAERATGHYSNRFAGHIVKQHQTMTLARQNGWRATHRMAVDAPNDDPMWTAFPQHGVYVEYWNAVPDTDAETTDSGAYVHLHTDRIVFHRLSGDPVKEGPLALRGARLDVGDVPPVVFSEVMRHADLMVAVASLAADPGWYDRGREAEHPSSWERDALTYFETATNADLSGAGKVRRDALERILPRLNIADRVDLADRYVAVRGVKRSYRVHIGSAAVHREPDGRHVCIVPKPRSLNIGDVRLPFEGDATLSLVLSKVLMLAADDKIKDQVILAQI